MVPKATVDWSGGGKGGGEKEKEEERKKERLTDVSRTSIKQRPV